MRLNEVRESFRNIKDGQKFIEKELEDQKEKNKDLIKDIKKMFLENQPLHNEVKALCQSQQQNRMKNDKFAQYN